MRFIRSFREWLKNPRRFRKEAEDYERQLVELQVPADARTIQAMVEQLLRQDSDSLAHERIRAQGARAVPALVWALQDPRFWKNKLGEGLSAMWPVERVLGILVFINPPEAVEPAAALLNHQDKAIRGAAARLLASIGNDACAEPVTRALRDESEDVARWATHGIGHSLKAKRCTPGFLNAVFEPLVAQLDRPGMGCHHGVSDWLLQIDRARAMSIFLSDRVLRAEYSQLSRVLRAVNSAGEKIPADKLLPLLGSLRPHIGEDPHDAAYAAALVALARSGSPDAESIIRRELASKNQQVHLGAADALAALNGALPPRDYFHRRTGSIDHRKLTQPQRICYCIDQLSMEVNNGGFSQYFFNSSGDLARDTLAALETVNAKRTAAMLRQAIAQFGPTGPSTDREERQDQIAALSEQQDAELSRLDAEFFKYPDNLDALLSLYAAEHSEHFRSEV